VDGSKFVIDALRSDGEFVLGRGRNSTVSSAVSILVLAPVAEHPAPELIRRLEHEYALSAELDAAWAVRPTQLTRDHGRTALILEDPGGEPLDRLLEAPLELEQFLRIAVGLSAALRQLHGRGFIHKDIKPANALVDPNTGQVRLMGFGIASRLPRELQPSEPPEFIAGTLPYMAPEQTGRMNRSIDSRSDLYSLGITLYEMLTGTLPFTAADPMEWVHCHIARRPVPPAERVKRVPALASAIIMKLLAKAAEERYQTAAGVEHDLRLCLAQWEAQGRIDNFRLGEHDTPDRLLIPEKLYGRARGVDALLAAFDGVASTGTPELVLVSGYSGIGKSSVVHELRKALVPQRGLFAAGKLDQYKRDVPYAPLAQAFQSLIRALLSKSEDELAEWRGILRKALDQNGQLMVDLIPELKLVIGEQPRVPELPPGEQQARFQLVFRRLLGVFARPEHPLVLFLDDLQWLDMGTLDLLGHLVASPEVRHVVLVGAYRANEVDPAHPLMQTVQAIQASGGRLREIVLTSLEPDDVECLVADALHCEREYVRPLADLVFEKTAGNPFFCVQFLTTLAEEGLLRFDTEAKVWQWDAGRISSKGYADNVLELMAAKIERLSAETQRSLMHCACLGHVADVRTLALLHGQSEDAIRASLLDAVRNGLLVRVERGYQFIHDRVREAAYALIPAANRGAVHLRIGRILLERMSAPEVRDDVFELVNHLNAGLALITDADESDRLAELNLVAGQKAKAATAYASASRYLSIGMDLLGSAGWDRRYQLAFGLWLEAGECEYLNGTLENAERLLSELLVHARSKLDRAAAYRLRIVFHMTNAAYEAAIDCGLECLRLLGIAVPRHPAREDFVTEYEQFWARSAGRSIESLIELPLATDPERRAVASVLTALFAPTSLTSSNLFYLLICRGANLTLEHGVSDATTHIYSGLAQILGPIFHRYEDGLRFGALSHELARKYGFGAVKAHFAMQNAAPWCRPIQTAIDHTRLGAGLAAASSDLSYACYFSHRLATYLLLQGSPLETVSWQCQEGIALARRLKFRDLADLMACQQAFIANMRGETAGFSSFNSALFDEAAFEAGLTGRMPAMVCWYWILKLEACFISRDFAAARAAARNAAALVSATQSFVQWVDYVYFGALSVAALHDDERPRTQAGELDEMRAHLAQLGEWADACPTTFLDKHALVGAEVARLEGREPDAMRLYERAIRAARDNGLVHHEAIACERAFAFYRARGFDDFAELYLRNARYCYARWGADGKVRQLDRLYPQILNEVRSPSATGTIGTTPVEQFDLATIFKVSQAVSSEIVLEKLIDKLMSIALEHAGAQRGLLILPHPDGLHVQAEAALGDEKVELGVRDAVVTPADLPESILRYVVRTHESVLLDDACLPNPYSSDPYIARNRSRSILCVPLLKQAKLIGVLYLENPLAARAFTPARVAVLDLLASQAAISLENARLYADLQNENAERRQSEEALRRSEERYALAVQAAGDGHTDWIVATDELYASPRALEMLGLPPDTIVAGRADFLARVNFHPEDRARMMHALDAYYAGDSPRLDLEVRVLRRGETRWLHFTVLCSRDAAGAVQRSSAAITDITERKLAEDALRQSEERFALAVAGANEGIFDWDLLTHRVYVSQRAQVLLGLPAGDLWRSRQAWRKIVNLHPDDTKLQRDSFKALIAGETPTCDVEFRVILPDGSQRWFRQRGIALRDAAGKAYRMVGSIGDITDRKQAQEELLRLERRLRQAQRLEAMGSLAAGIAHDFNNVLGVVLGYGEKALRELPHGSRLQRDLETIMTAGERGRALVDRVLAFSRSSVGQRVAMHAEKVVREALDLLAAKLPETVRVEADFAAGRATLLGDPTEMHQVVMNLASNAIHAMPQGGILSIGVHRARFEASRAGAVGGVERGDYIVLRVADTGVGIAPGILERIFDPFFTTKEVGIGTGLGLSLVHGIVTQMGGAIDVASQVGAGTTFTVYLPRSDDVAESEPPPEAALPRGSGQCVLVVDDEEPLVSLATRTLEDLGYAPVGFTSSAAALTAFSNEPQRFHAVITDERMPKMTGSALIEALRVIRHEVPILLMSGYVGGALASRARTAGVDEVLKKPLLARDLATSLARVLQPRAPRP
jgi:PAS domain S-box-containing protein